MLNRSSRVAGLQAAACVVVATLISGCGSSQPVSSSSAGQGPSRCGDVAARPWCHASLSPSARSDLLIGKMTLMQKLSLLAGDDIVAAASGDPYSGISEGIPDLRMSDGPVGVRGSEATAFPTPLSLASSFDPRLATRIGKAVANEVRHKGNDLLHAPVLDIMRNPLPVDALLTWAAQGANNWQTLMAFSIHRVLFYGRLK